MNPLLDSIMHWSIPFRTKIGFPIGSPHEYVRARVTGFWDDTTRPAEFHLGHMYGLLSDVSY